MRLGIRRHRTNREQWPQTVQLDVTQAHIDAGEPRSWEANPIALAVADAFPGACDISACGSFAEFELQGRGKLYLDFPYREPDVTDFTDRFLHGEPVSPFTVTARVDRLWPKREPSGR